MDIPEGFGNAQYIFTCDGVLDPMSFALGTTATISDPGDDVAEALFDAIFETVMVSAGYIQGSWTFVGVRYTRTEGGLPVVYEHFENVVGTGPDNTVPVNCALLIRKQTAAGGRKNRGRMFWPPFHVDELAVNNAGVISSGFVSARQSELALWHARLGNDGNAPYLFHTDPADPATLITGFQCQSLLATQRRRMR